MTSDGRLSGRLRCAWHDRCCGVAAAALGCCCFGVAAAAVGCSPDTANTLIPPPPGRRDFTDWCSGKMHMQISGEQGQTQVMADLDVRGVDWNAQLKLGNPGFYGARLLGCWGLADTAIAGGKRVGG